MFLSSIKKVFVLSIIIIFGMLFTVSSVSAKTEMDMWTFVNAHAEFYEMMAENWNEENPDRQITLNTQVLPFNQMHDKLNIALQTGMGAPDIVDIEIGKFPGILENNAETLVDLTSVIDEYREDILEARLAPYSTPDSKVYGIPTHVGTYLMYYNVDMLEEAGVSIDDIETWDDYIEAGKKVSKDTDGDGEKDQFMLAVPSEEAAAFDGMSRQLGSNYFDQDGNVILDREENIRTLNRLKDFVYEYEIADVVTDYHEQNFYNALNNEKYASIFMPQWYMIRFTDFMPDLKGKIRVRPLPAWPNGEGTLSTMGGGTGTAVTQEASDVELAKEFLAYAKLTREAGVKIWTDLGFDPIVTDAYNDESFQEKFPYFGNEKVMLTIQDLQSEIQPLYFSDLLTRLRDQLNEETLYEIFENGGDVEKNIKEAAEKLRAEQ